MREAFGFCMLVPDHGRELLAWLLPVVLAKLGAALIAAKENGADLGDAVAVSVGWDKLAASVAAAQSLARPR